MKYLGFIKSLLILVLPAFVCSISIARPIDSSTEAASGCVRCNSEAYAASSSSGQKNLDNLRAASGVQERRRDPILQMSTVIGKNPIVEFPNRQAPNPTEFDVSSGVCVLTPSNPELGGTAFFVGARLNMLVTNMHTMALSGPVHDQTLRLQCGLKGHGFNRLVQVKVEAQGRYNLDGGEGHDEEDVVLLSIVDSGAVFKDYKHFSFTVTEPADGIDSAMKKKIGLMAFPGSDASIVTEHGVLSSARVRCFEVDHVMFLKQQVELCGRTTVRRYPVVPAALCTLIADRNLQSLRGCMRRA